jgi:hypothetical protein
MHLKSSIFYNRQGLFPSILYIDDILIQNRMSQVYSDVKSQDWTVDDHRLLIVLLTRYQNPVYPHNLPRSCYSPINHWRNFQIWAPEDESEFYSQDSADQSINITPFQLTFCMILNPKVNFSFLHNLSRSYPFHINLQT